MRLKCIKIEVLINLNSPVKIKYCISPEVHLLFTINGIDIEMDLPCFEFGTVHLSLKNK
jgi:hypothetical protein